MVVVDMFLFSAETEGVQMEATNLSFRTTLNCPAETPFTDVNWTITEPRTTETTRERKGHSDRGLFCFLFFVDNGKWMVLLSTFFTPTSWSFQYFLLVVQMWWCFK